VDHRLQTFLRLVQFLKPGIVITSHKRSLRRIRESPGCV
jgi:hypothetical protein